MNSQLKRLGQGLGRLIRGAATATRGSGAAGRPLSTERRRNAPAPITHALVTGGAGFLGRALVAALRQRGVAVRVLDLRPHPEAPSLVGDVAEPEAVARAVEGVDTVFHVAARIDWSLNKTAQLERANVEGTATVIRACEAAGVARLVHTSSVDVMSGGGPIEGGDESLPLAARHYDDDHRARPPGALVLAARLAAPPDRHRLGDRQTPTHHRELKHRAIPLTRLWRAQTPRRKDALPWRLGALARSS